MQTQSFRMKKSRTAAAARRENLGRVLFGLGLSLSICGFYAAMIVFQIVTGSIEGTRSLSIPLRVAILSLLISGAILLARNVRISRPPIVEIFLSLFAISYLLRIYVSRGDAHFLHRDPTEILLYFLAFCLFPFLAIRLVDMTSARIASIFRLIVLGALAFAVLVSFAFQDIINIGARAAISFGANDIISPLFFSYCGSIGVGLGVAGFFNTASSKRMRILLLATAILSLVPFFIGGSRGAIVALVLPFLLFMPFTRSRRIWARIVALASLAIMVGVASLYLDVTAFRRMSEILNDIDSGAAEASRVYLWTSSFEQFWDNPIFGNSLENDTFSYYPHNFVLEAFISTGIIGGVPLLAAVWLCVRRCHSITKFQPHNYWVVVLFLQTLTHALFSGALYSAVWLSTSMAFLISVSRSTELQRRIHRNSKYPNLKDPELKVHPKRFVHSTFD
ncbi:O-antigen ligase family protein [Qipengyuania sp. 1XM1-15A]|uniref:O-antigen ligase family protein n=1 Tax=Qipengyuania xiamenensis TaxID=2867237 RepID=UPI001C8696EC|nr:O-antigen ligase family protein [Qipengyuania xiamenensis]MBX7531765.1 O-antigen ligase family protein [Qipengyuania xiamenensis]